MKFIMSFMLIGLLILSCKKETQTQTSTTDSISADTVSVDTATNASPTPVPLPSDTVRTDSTAAKNNIDSAGTTRNGNTKK